MRTLFLACSLLACSQSETGGPTDSGTTAATVDLTDAPTTDEPDPTTTAGETTYTVSVWADNWSSMYIDGTLVMEDSVPITTERSFNEEVFTFTATPPFQVAVELKDFKETDSGLEYIGEPNQQMGDGGYIAQFVRGDGSTALVSDASWVCLVTHQAPLNKDCESSADPDTDCLFATVDTPEGWADPDFDDSQWAAASVHTEAEVSPKEGYDRVTWDPAAALIWGTDLETDNTLLCRVTVDG